MRLLVCGDRNWTDKEIIRAALQKYDPEVVIEGEAPGADLLAREVALELGIDVVAFPANWTKYGKAAGPIRNGRMLKEGRPDFVLALHNDLRRSRGTIDMIRQTLRRKKLVRLIYRGERAYHVRTMASISDLKRLTESG